MPVIKMFPNKSKVSLNATLVWASWLSTSWPCSLLLSRWYKDGFQFRLTHNTYVAIFFERAWSSMNNYSAISNVPCSNQEVLVETGFHMCISHICIPIACLFSSWAKSHIKTCLLHSGLSFLVLSYNIHKKILLCVNAQAQAETLTVSV